ncbi:hypothetical protein VPH35_068372 [Triticum aestivum]
MKQLLPAFNKIRKLSVRGIFVEFNLERTVAFLVAAPCIEMLHIESRKLYTERRTPQWEMHFDGPKNRFLKELEFSGFRSLEQQFTFIKSMLEQAPNLQTIILKGDERCDSCDALDTPRPLKFPKKDEQQMVVRRIRDGIFSPRIIFDE